MYPYPPQNSLPSLIEHSAAKEDMIQGFLIITKTTFLVQNHANSDESIFG